MARSSRVRQGVCKRPSASCPSTPKKPVYSTKITSVEHYPPAAAPTICLQYPSNPAQVFPLQPQTALPTQRGGGREPTALFPHRPRSSKPASRQGRRALLLSWAWLVGWRPIFSFY